MSGTKTEITKLPMGDGSLDDYITSVSLYRNMGEILSQRARSTNARTYFVNNLIVSAVFDLDVGLISEIVKRIDGSAPQKGDMDGYSNIFGDALEDVLSYEDAESMRVFPSDEAIIALAKAVICIANTDPGKNMQARKDRQKAVQMILDRVEGRRSEPAKPVEQFTYEAPDWMALPKGDDDGEDQ